MPPRPPWRVWWSTVKSQGVVVIDCQLPSRHLQSLGSRLISRAHFQGLLREHIAMATAFVQYPRPNV